MSRDESGLKWISNVVSAASSSSNDAANWTGSTLRASTQINVHGNVFLESRKQFFGFINQPISKTVKEEMMMAGYGLGLSLFSPVANLYQLAALYPNVKSMLCSSRGLTFRICSSIYPQQVALRIAQVNLGTPVKDHLSPWVAFGVLGVLQGAVYGHANINFARKLKIDKTLKLSMIFRGSGFAALRDTISQGIPFMLSDAIRTKCLDPILPSKDPFNNHAKRWSSLIYCSIVSTYLSQGFHNCQTAMQTHPELSYVGSLNSMMKTHGVRFLWKGAEARVGLLVVTNIFNEVFLKPIWHGNL
mmetsp:Transcript_10146/g.16402  ORF Transcript_10146/g.16402 Transcript_10146/m.16402 type:complete len:302 (+) Transcript_10146:100-1005(+)|eukprot:jgi/Bigna1/91450/estExt_fgenesh1_pg.C_1010028